MINIIPASTDAGELGGNNAALLKALKERKQLAEMLGGSTSRKQNDAPAFAPRNNAQAAVGYGATALQGVFERLALEKQKKQQLAGAKNAAAVLRGLGGPHGPFASISDAQAIGIFMANPEIGKILMTQAAQAATRDPYTERDPTKEYIDKRRLGQAGANGLIPAPQQQQPQMAPQGAMAGAAPAMPATMAQAPRHPAVVLPAQPKQHLEVTDEERRARGLPPVSVTGPITRGPDGKYDAAFTSGFPSGVNLPGQKALDEKFGQNYADFVTEGGYADARKNLTQIRDALKQLRSGGEYSGSIIGNTPDRVLSIFNPKAVQLREQVHEVAQRNLRAVLGGQFAQQEGKELIERSYNPRLPEAMNAERLERLLDAMQKGYDARVAAVKHFEQHGTMQGYKGPQPMTLQDLRVAVEGEKKSDAQGSEAPQQQQPQQPGGIVDWQTFFGAQ